MYTTITIKQILDRKGHQVWSVDPNITVKEALGFMAQKNIGAVMIMANGRLHGIFSERDYARKVVLQGKNETSTRVKEVMTSPVIAIRHDQKIEECLALMTGKFIRHLPVIEDGAILGVISIGDVVKEIISEQVFVIDQLVNYISGEVPKPAIPAKTMFE